MPSNYFPVYNAYTPYQNNAYQQQPMIVPQAQPSYQQNTITGICWVDGEVGAKAQQIPPGWDTTKPFPMWDTNEQIIYLKSFNPMGMPNPLTKLHYTIEEPTKQAPMMSSQASLPQGETPDMNQYAKKDDLEKMKRELMEAMQEKGAKGNGKSAV